MPLELRDVRKVAVLSWDLDHIKGKTASIQVHGEEKRTVDNDGESNLFFPMDFSGERRVTVAGSKSGEESAHIEIP